MNLKIRLWMIADRTDFRCLCAHHDMSAVTAFPYLNFTLLKHSRRLNVLQKRAITLLMMFLNLANRSEFCRDRKSVV